MLTREEQQYLIWVTSALRRGSGAVVDLGPWLGCSSAALAEGVRRSGGGVRVQSLDLFEWRRDYMEGYCPADLPEGSDFRPLFREQTAAYSDTIDAERMDLLAGTWRGGPIEILFVDAAKSWDLTNAILRVFGPSLVPGESLVVLQDFKHMPTFWLPLVFDSRPDLWEELHDLASGDTATYRLRAPLDAAAGAEADFSKDSFRAEQVVEIFSRRLERPGGRRIGLSYYRALLTYDQFGRAEELLAKLLSAASPQELARLENSAKKARWAWRDEGLQPLWGAIQTGELDLADRIATAFELAEEPRGMVAIGRIAQLRGDHRLALDWFERAQAGGASIDHSVVMFQATSWVATRQFDAATRAIVDLLLSEPALPKDQRTWALFILRDCWRTQRNAEVALTSCARLLERHPDSPEILVFASMVARECENPQRADQLLGRARVLDPGNAETKWMFE
ncbi:MAG: hypothetical protein KDC48_01420 [Planctomycetes bacterium]|nr:hypothetical protein [Planctomycetota bacterium]